MADIASKYIAIMSILKYQSLVFFTLLVYSQRLTHFRRAKFTQKNSKNYKKKKALYKPSDKCQRMLDSWVSCSGSDSFCCSSITAKHIKNINKNVKGFSITASYKNPSKNP